MCTRRNRRRRRRIARPPRRSDPRLTPRWSQNLARVARPASNRDQPIRPGIGSRSHHRRGWWYPCRSPPYCGWPGRDREAASCPERPVPPPSLQRRCKRGEPPQRRARDEARERSGEWGLSFFPLVCAEHENRGEWRAKAGHQSALRWSESDRHVICSRDAPKEHPIQIESTCSGSRMAETKVIRTFANEVEAYVAQAVLDANGIDSRSDSR